MNAAPVLFRGGCFYALSVKAFYGRFTGFCCLAVTDTIAHIKCRVGRSNGICGGVMMWGVRAVYSCPVFLRFFGLIGAAGMGDGGGGYASGSEGGVN